MERPMRWPRSKDVAAEVLSVEPDRVTEEARFKEDLDADSLDLVELVMGLEERFDIEVPEDDLEGVTTVGHAVDLVLTKVAERGATTCTDGTRSRGRVRVAVTGLGVKTPAGNDLDTFWARLAAGRSTAATIERFDPSPLPVRIRVRGARLRPDRVPRREGSAPHRPGHPARCSRPRPTRSPTPATRRRSGALCA